MPTLLDPLLWPAVAIAAVVILRRPISELIQTTRRVRVRNLEVEFDSQISRIEFAATQVLPLRPPQTQPEPCHIAVDLHRLADASPRAAVIESWRSVERTAKELIAVGGFTIDYRAQTPYKRMQEILVGNQIIEEQSGRVFEHLRLLRNKVVHAKGFRLSTEQAKHYVDVAINLQAYLDGLVTTRRAA